jgi:hypothetical protein
VREIRTLRSTWRGLETWHGIGLNRRASPRPYHVSFTRFTATLAGPVVIVTLYWRHRC